METTSHAGTCVSAEFVGPDGIMLDGTAGVPPGTYVTIRIDDTDAAVSGGPVVLTWTAALTDVE
jgi:hypothetical protein